MSSVHVESGRLPGEITASYHLSAIIDEREPVMFLPQEVCEEGKDYDYINPTICKKLVHLFTSLFCHLHRIISAFLKFLVTETLNAKKSYL